MRRNQVLVLALLALALQLEAGFGQQVAPLQSTPSPPLAGAPLAATTAAPPVVAPPLPISTRRPAPGDIPTTLQTIADVTAQQRARQLSEQQADQQQQQQQQRQRPLAQLLTPASGSRAQEPNAPTAGSLEQRVQWPMVDVERQRNKSTVDVHVPIFFDMVNQKDDSAGRSKLDLSVLQGLVTVNHDKSRTQDGQVAGPLKVTVFGIPVYTSRGLPPAARPLERAQRDDFETAADKLNSTLTRKADELVAQVQGHQARTNEKMLQSLSDIFERFSAAVRQTGKSLSTSANSILGSQVQQDAGQQGPTSAPPAGSKSEHQLKAEREFARSNSNKPLAERVSYDFRS